MNYLKQIVGSLALCGLLFTISCENYQPETFHISDFDMEACTELSDSVFAELTPVPADTFNSTWADSSINEVAGQFLDSLVASEIIMHAPFDSLTIIPYPSNVDTSYFALSSSADRWVFFFTDHIDFKLYNEQGAKIDPANTLVDPATSLECDTMKTRVEYELSNTQYLLQLIETDKVENSEVRFWMAPKP